MASMRAPTNDCAVAVIGAGPYGIAAASALKAAGVEPRAFGKAMSFWSDNMPKGMKLRSPWRASHIGTTRGPLSLDSYAQGHGIAFQEPLPLDTFIDYGKWVQSNGVGDLDPRSVRRVEKSQNGFRLVLADDDVVSTRRVVVALGLLNQQFIPSIFDGLPRELVSHSCDHADLGTFRGKRVAVVGRGQSACESAALLKAEGADVELVCRGPIKWLGHLQVSDQRKRGAKRLLSQFLEAPSAVGPFPFSWMVEVPDVVRHVPTATRAAFSNRCLRAGAAGWVWPDFAGITVTTPQTITGACETSGRIELRFEDGAATYDHVLLATGYRIDVSRTGILGADILASLARQNGSPILSDGFMSNIDGLHFVGASAVFSYGPLMRFVAGTPYAARRLSSFVKRQDLRRPVGVPTAAVTAPVESYTA